LSDHACRDCHEWRGCPGYPWYSPNEIVYCDAQNRWMIGNFVEIRAGRISMFRHVWPPERIETGYDDTPIMQGLKAAGPTDLTNQVVGELVWRLSHAGKRGIHGRTLILELWREVSLSKNQKTLSPTVAANTRTCPIPVVGNN